MKRFPILALLGCALSGADMIAAPELEKLRSEFDAKLNQVRADQAKAVEDLGTKYLEALERERDNVASTGDLTRVQFFRDEIKRFKMERPKPAAPDEASPERLKDLINTYSDSLNKRKTVEARAILECAADFDRQFRGLQESWTKERKFDAATEAQRERETIKSLPDVAKSIALLGEPEPPLGATKEVVLLGLDGRVIGARAYAKGNWVDLWNDKAAVIRWTELSIPPGEYEVSVTYGCHLNGGGHFEIEVDDKTLKGEAQPTGGWTQFERRVVGELQIAPEATEVAVRTILIRNRYLWIFRSLHLTPSKASR